MAPAAQDLPLSSVPRHSSPKTPASHDETATCLIAKTLSRCVMRYCERNVGSETSSGRRRKYSRPRNHRDILRRRSNLLLDADGKRAAGHQPNTKRQFEILRNLTNCPAKLQTSLRMNLKANTSVWAKESSHQGRNDIRETRRAC